MNLTFYNTVLPEGVYSGTITGNSVIFTVEDVRYGFWTEFYVKGIDCQLTVEVKHKAP